MISFWKLILVVLLLVFMVNVVDSTTTTQQDLEQTVYGYFETLLSRPGLKMEQIDLIRECRLGQADALFTMAKRMESSSPESRALGAPNDKLALELYTLAANDKDHVLSQARLGRIYAQGNRIVEPSFSKALYYYQRAGKNGHHASLYNAGLLLWEQHQPDIVGSIAYFHAAATLHLNYPELQDPKITVYATRAHEQVSLAAASATDLTLRQVADLFVYATMETQLHPKVESLWRDSVAAQMAFNETIVESNGQQRDMDQLKRAKRALASLLDKHKSKLTNLQQYLALDNLNDVLGPLVESDLSYLPEAARQAEALLSSPLCWASPDSVCPQRAAINALGYYRRIGDHDGVKRISALGSSPIESEL